MNKIVNTEAFEEEAEALKDYLSGRKLTTYEITLLMRWQLDSLENIHRRLLEHRLKQDGKGYHFAGRQKSKPEHSSGKGSIEAGPDRAGPAVKKAA